jgi:Type II secretion system (T2SS), protein E, N-terminal domain
MAITLLDMLLDAGLITREQFEEALLNRVVYGGKIGTSLIELGYVTEENLARFLSKKLAVPYVAPDHLLAIPPTVISLIPQDLALKYRVIPISLEKRRLNLVMADPADLKAIDEISFITGYIVKPLVAPEVRLVQALGKYYQLEIDHRYQQIIERIEELKATAAAIAAVKPAKADEPARQTSEEIPKPTPLPIAEQKLEEVEVVVEEESWIERIGHYSIDYVSKALAKAEDREEIAEILIGYLGQEFERGALFQVRGGSVYGWKSIYRQQEVKDFPRFALPLTEPSVLKTVAQGAVFHMGPIPETPFNQIMLDWMGGGQPDTAVLLPLLIMGRVVNILYAEGKEKELGGRFVELQKLMTKAVLAFEILIFRDKILMI